MRKTWFFSLALIASCYSSSFPECPTQCERGAVVRPSLDLDEGPALWPTDSCVSVHYEPTPDEALISALRAAVEVFNAIDCSELCFTEPEERHIEYDPATWYRTNSRPPGVHFWWTEEVGESNHGVGSNEGVLENAWVHTGGIERYEGNVEALLLASAGFGTCGALTVDSVLRGEPTLTPLDIMAVCEYYGSVCEER